MESGTACRDPRLSRDAQPPAGTIFAGERPITRRAFNAVSSRRKPFRPAKTTEIGILAREMLAVSDTVTAKPASVGVARLRKGGISTSVRYDDLQFAPNSLVIADA
ncbi:hypothetical protein JCM19992_00830 [Thermostilla marina]